MLSYRSKVVRGVMAFLAGCALLGLFMGLRGALPGNVDPDFESAAPVSTPSGVVIEATPIAENALVATNEATNDVATNEVEEEEEADEPAAPQPEPATPATSAPSEEAPPADPVGELIQQPAPPPPGDLY